MFLLLVDYQKCFTRPDGALFVKGADEDVKRVKSFISSRDDIAKVCITGDFHQPKMISFPNYWINDKGEHPAPFSSISKQDVIDGVWKRNGSVNGDYGDLNNETTEWPIDYFESLESKNEETLNSSFELRIWPYHAIAGTEGCCFDDIGMEGIYDKLTIIMKGTNPNTEQQGALQPDFSILNRIDASIFSWLKEWAKSDDILAISGEAMDICLAYTVYSLIDNLSIFGDLEVLKSRIVLIRDFMSPIYPELGKEFLDKMTSLGIKIKNSSEM